jgi:hypothetical protein
MKKSGPESWRVPESVADSRAARRAAKGLCAFSPCRRVAPNRTSIERFLVAVSIKWKHWSGQKVKNRQLPHFHGPSPETSPTKVAFGAYPRFQEHSDGSAGDKAGRPQEKARQKTGLGLGPLRMALVPSSFTNLDIAPHRVQPKGWGEALTGSRSFRCSERMKDGKNYVGLSKG